LSATYVGREGRCRGKNHNEVQSKSGPVVCGEEKLWNGSLRSPIFSKNLRDLDESEQGGQIGIGKATSHHEKARNGAITAPLPTSLEATEESRRNSLRMRRTEAKGVEGSTFHALTKVEENKGGGVTLHIIQYRGGKIRYESHKRGRQTNHLSNFQTNRSKAIFNRIRSQTE